LAVEPNKPSAAPVWLDGLKREARLAWLERRLSVCQTCQTWAGGATSSRRRVVSIGYSHQYTLNGLADDPLASLRSV
jgi:hypothetical protein